MSEKRADQLQTGRHTVVGKDVYDAPTAEWHDLRVITLGGSPGDGDSGDTQSDFAGSSSNNPDGRRGSNHYDGNPDDEFGNYV